MHEKYTKMTSKQVLAYAVAPQGLMEAVLYGDGRLKVTVWVDSLG